jgi:hypothetical protein
MPKTGEKLQTLITVLITWGLLLALFIVYESYFVRTQQAFLRERAFHSLERVAEELEAQVQRARVSTKSFVLLAARRQLPERLPDFLRLYLKDALSYENDDKAARNSIEAAKKCRTDELPSSLHLKSEGLTLTFSCSESRSPIYTLDLTSWVKDALRPLGGDFDDLLIADATGDVLFQRSSELPHITDLRTLIVKTGGEPVQKNSESPVLGGAKQSSNHENQNENNAQAKVSPETERFQRTTAANFSTPTTLGGVSYELFSVPLRISLGDFSLGQRSTLLVCGLWSTDRFDSESHAIPYSDLIWAALIGTTVFALSWPFVKLRYMSNTERFTPRDGWLLTITILLAATSGTLMILNASYNSQTQRETDRNLKKLADLIRGNFTKEMMQALVQMQQLQPFDSDEKADILIPDYLGVAQQRLTYPFFEIAFWADQSGKQLSKLDIRPSPTPIINVKKFAFFTRVIAEEQWHDSPVAPLLSKSAKPKDYLDGHDYHYYLEPQISITTAEFSPILSTRAPRRGIRDVKVQALSVRPMSLVEPVLPPGYGFAVVDAQCNVLFHSQIFRDKKENFCQESKGASELRPWLFGESASPIDISYAGRPERAFITPMRTPVENSIVDVETPSGAKMKARAKMPEFANGPTYLVVFRVPDYALTLNLAIVVVCAILLGFYFVLLFLIAIVVNSFLRRTLRAIDPRRLIWPCAENGVEYLQIFTVNAIILLLYWFYYVRLYEAPLLTLSGLVSCLCVLLPLFKFSGRSRLLSRFGLIRIATSVMVLAAIIANWIANRIANRTVTNSDISEWWRVFAFLGIAGTIALLLSSTHRWGEHVSARIPKMAAWIKSLAETNFAVVYSLAALTVVTAGATVPCIACFKFAYDAVNEMALKHAEIEVSESLLAHESHSEVL